MGPIIIYDKSAIQSLALDEAVWLDVFYLANVTPVFFVETLADLNKPAPDGRSAEDVVRALADMTPVSGSHANQHHSLLCMGELLGGTFDMRGVPVISGGIPVAKGSQRGTQFDTPPEVEALQRWQRGEFQDIEHGFAREWRASLSKLNLRSIYEKYRNPPCGRPATLSEARAAADDLVRGKPGYRFATMKQAMDMLPLPGHRARAAILDRWRQAGCPPLHEYAPYTAHVLTVDTFFNLAIGADLISRERPSNKVDLAYLYYLPFCMVFSSNDKLHERCVPLFLNGKQRFVPGRELKADLRRLDTHYSSFPEEVRERGVLAFAHYPPEDGDFLVSRLWDIFMRPDWRQLASAPPLSAQAMSRLHEEMKNITAAKPPRPSSPRTVDDTGRGDFALFQRRVPGRIGKWRMVPPEACDS